MNYFNKVVLVFVCFLIPCVWGVVVGMDLGSQSLKMGIIRNNAFEIILDGQSRRKTPTAVSFFNGDRYFGTDALRMEQRNPQQSYLFINQLLGQAVNSSYISSIKPFLGYSDKLFANSRNAISIQYDEDTTFSPEELMGMLFEYCSQITADYTGSKITDIVITVPPFLTPDERTALLTAAKLANLNVLSLLHDGTSAALHFAFGKKFEEIAEQRIFLDIGHSSTSATLIEFRGILAKNNKTLPQLKVKSVAWDRLLGGRDFTERLTSHFVELAEKQLREDLAKGKRTHLKEYLQKSITENPRVIIKLRDAAEKAKLVLSANQEAIASVEGLLPEFDWRTTITRSEFEKLTNDLIERIVKTVTRSINSGNITVNDLNGFEIIGGSVRIPKIQSSLAELLGKDVDKHLNGDEASTLGAMYYAAQLSTTMKVPVYKVKDAAGYNVLADIILENNNIENNNNEKIIDDVEDKDVVVGGDDEVKDDSDDDVINGSVKSIVLFEKNNRLGLVKTLKFHTRNDNFSVAVSFDDLAFGRSDDDENNKISGLFEEIEISNISQVEKYNYTKTPKIQVSWRLSTSGLVELEKAEAIVSVVVYPTIVPDLSDNDNSSSDNDTLSPDSSDSSDDSDVKDKKEQDSESESKTSSDKKKDSDKPKTKGGRRNRDKTKNKSKKDDQPKKYVHRVPLTIRKTSHKTITEFNTEDITLAKKTLTVWNRKDLAKKELADTKNELEAFLYTLKDKFDVDSASDLGSLVPFSTKAERTAILDAVDAGTLWLDDAEDDVPLEDVRAQLKELKSLSKPIETRKDEKEKLPGLFKALKAVVKLTVTEAAKLPERFEVEQEDVDELVVLCEETGDWVETKSAEQALTKDWEDPVVTSSELNRKLRMIEYEMKRLLRSPLKKPPKVAKNTTDSDLEDDSVGKKNTTTVIDEDEDEDEDDATTNETDKKVEVETDKEEEIKIEHEVKFGKQDVEDIL